MMDLFDNISELGKRRGIFYPSFEIYGGVSGFYDYGPIGSLLKRNLVDKWRQLFVNREGMVELESTVIMSERVFLSSGHIAHFTDVLTRCIKCGQEYRVDYLLKDAGYPDMEGLVEKELDRFIREKGVNCPDCGGGLSEAKPFNLMFEFKIGSYGERQTGYGRPEAGQGQFLDFKRIYASERERLPLGIAQVGRCVRNEIAPRKGPIRLREFTIIDYEVFFDPMDASYPRIGFLKDQKLRILTEDEQLGGGEEALEVTVGDALDNGMIGNEILCYFMALAVRFLVGLGIPREKQRLREQLSDERAHYSDQTFDQEVWLERWGWTEISGHAYRTDYDLRNHMTHSGVDMRVYKAFDEPRRVSRVKVKPLADQLSHKFGAEDGKRIARLISNSDPSVVERELRVKGFYEITGRHPVKVIASDLEIKRIEAVERGRYFIPHVVEPSFGIDRILYSALEYAFTSKDKRIVLKLPRDIAPVKAAVFPLVNRDDLPKLAQEIHKAIVNEGLIATYDDSGSIGRRYARADEIGVPLCITIDYQSLEDDTVTLRDIKTWEQVRTKARGIESLLQKYYKKKIEFKELGTPV